MHELDRPRTCNEWCDSQYLGEVTAFVTVLGRQQLERARNLELSEFQLPLPRERLRLPRDPHIRLFIDTPF